MGPVKTSFKDKLGNLIKLEMQEILSKLTNFSLNH